MLGNNADAFFTTPMKTSITTGGNAAYAGRNEMPAPWMPASATASASSALPGMGADTTSAAEAGLIVADTKKFLGFGLPVIGLIALGAFLLLKK